MCLMKSRKNYLWQDTVKNVGKLSLAGLFVAGTLFVTHAYADEAAVQALSTTSASPGDLCGMPQSSNG